MSFDFLGKKMSSTLKTFKHKKKDGTNFPPWTHEEKQKFVSGMYNQNSSRINLGFFYNLTF